MKSGSVGQDLFIFCYRPRPNSRVHAEPSLTPCILAGKMGTTGLKSMGFISN